MTFRKKKTGVVIQLGHTIRQKINPTAVAASLLEDTHNAQQNIVSDQLVIVRSVRQEADIARAAQKSVKDELVNESNIDCSDWGNAFCFESILCTQYAVI